MFRQARSTEHGQVVACNVIMDNEAAGGHTPDSANSLTNSLPLFFLPSIVNCHVGPVVAHSRCHCVVLDCLSPGFASLGSMSVI